MLRAFLVRKDVKRPFDLKVLYHAAALECCDGELWEKPKAVLEELKSCGAIGGYNSEGTSWIRK